MSEETWKPIAGYEKYQISNLGRVRSSGRFKGKDILKPLPSSDGYLRVNLYKNGKRRTTRIAGLVLETFVGPRPKDMECAHLNGIKTDNRIENLKWATRSENAYHKVAHGTHKYNRGSKHGNSKLTEKDILFIRENFVRTSRLTSNSKYLADKFGISSRYVCEIARGCGWPHVIARQALERGEQLIYGRKE